MCSEEIQKQALGQPFVDGCIADKYANENVPRGLQGINCSADVVRALPDSSKAWAAAYAKLVWMVERTPVALSGSIEELIPPEVEKHSHSHNTNLKSAVS